MWKLIAATCTLYMASTAYRALYNLLFSPLASIPGPRAAAMSDSWLKWHTIRLQRTTVIHNALQRYGPVVRIGPNKIALSSPVDVRRIYSSESFLKSDWYDGLTFGGIDNIFTVRDPALHAAARRWCAPTFRRDALNSISFDVQEVLGHLSRNIIHHSLAGSAIDVLPLFQLFALDVTLVAIAGTRLDLTKSGQSHPCTKHLHNWIYEKGMSTSLPTWLYRTLRRLPSRRLQSIFSADPAVISLVSQLYEANNSEGPDLVSTAKGYTDDKNGTSLPRDEILAQAAIFVAAGTDTMSIALTYISYELALNKAFIDNIRAELAGRPAQDLGLDVLKELPYLSAFLKEVLRVHGPAPMFLERVVPAGGATLGGWMLPGGTVVGAQAWTAHRNDKFFPDPLCVRPERWVKPSRAGQWMHREDLSPGMQASYFPFSQGPRGCIGRPLAEMVLPLVIVTLVSNFDIALHESTTPDSMEPLDIGAFGPKGKQCMLHFVRKP